VKEFTNKTTPLEAARVRETKSHNLWQKAVTSGRFRKLKRRREAWRPQLKQEGRSNSTPVVVTSAKSDPPAGGVRNLNWRVEFTKTSLLSASPSGKSAFVSLFGTLLIVPRRRKIELLWRNEGEKLGRVWNKQTRTSHY